MFEAYREKHRCQEESNRENETFAVEINLGRNINIQIFYTSTDFLMVQINYK